MRRFAVLTACLLAAALVLAACGGEAAPPAATKVQIEASEYAFAPNTANAKAGAPLEVTLVNKGIVEHDFVIDELNVRVLAVVGREGQGTIAAPPAGTYTFYCSIPGHREQGMTGTLTVD
jgi:uncharacterized cupredoxin-like copper-binding protein